MILKQITHYLTAEGEQFFPQWLQQLKAARTAGFGGIHYGNDDAAMCLLLWFDDEAALQRWTDEPMHQQLLDALAPYLSKPSEIRHLVLTNA